MFEILVILVLLMAETILAVGFVMLILGLFLLSVKIVGCVLHLVVSRQSEPLASLSP